MAGVKVPVTLRALVQRCNRKLDDNHRAIRKTRGAKAEQDLGEYYLLDTYRNFVVDTDINVEDLARELGVMDEWERVAEEE